MEETKPLIDQSNSMRSRRRDIAMMLLKTVYAAVYVGIISLADAYVLRRLIYWRMSEKNLPYDPLLQWLGFGVGYLANIKHGAVMLNSRRKNHRNIPNTCTTLVKTLIVILPSFSLAGDGWFDFNFSIPFVAQVAIAGLLGVLLVEGDLQYYSSELNLKRFWLELKNFYSKPGKIYRLPLLAYVSGGTVASNALVSYWSVKSLISVLLEGSNVTNKDLLYYTPVGISSGISALYVLLEFFKENVALLTYFNKRKYTKGRRGVAVTVAVTSFWTSLQLILAVLALDGARDNLSLQIMLTILTVFSFVVPNTFSSYVTSIGSVGNAFTGNLFAIGNDPRLLYAPAESLLDQIDTIGKADDIDSGPDQRHCCI